MTIYNLFSGDIPQLNNLNDGDIIFSAEGEIKLPFDEFFHNIHDNINTDIDLTFIYSDVNLLNNYSLWANLNNIKYRIPHLISNPLYYLKRTGNYLFDGKLNRYETDKIYHAVSLNAAEKDFRFKLIDDLYDYHLDNKFIFSWLHRYNYTKNYSSKKFNGRQVILDFDKQSIDYDSNQELVPKQYHESIIDIVCESFVSETSLMLTEKTWKPIVYKKPFIILGPKGIHSYLKELGFELYDELFDYSFDNLLYEDRINSIINQMTEIFNIPLNELKFDKSKLEHNFFIFEKLYYESKIIYY